MELSHSPPRLRAGHPCLWIRTHPHRVDATRGEISWGARQPPPGRAKLSRLDNARGMSSEWWSGAGSLVAHITGRAAWPAVTLFLAGTAAAFGASRVWGPPYTAPRRAMSVGLGVVAAACFVVATILPLLLH
jgi:hypothetical protein